MGKIGKSEMHEAEDTFAEGTLIEEIMRHLDTESSQGVVRMSVTMDEEAEVAKQVSHKCCHMYGRPANETVGMLDMYTDIAGGEGNA